MPMIPVTNDGSTTRYVGSIAIQPGETREVPEHLVPAEASVEATADPTEDDAIAQILDHNVSTIIDMLPQFSGDELFRVELAETNGAARKSLLKAIAEERLTRAATDNDAGEIDAGA